MSKAIKPQVHGIFDPATWTVTYVVYEKEGAPCAIIDSVLDYDPKSGRTRTDSADKVIAFVREKISASLEYSRRMRMPITSCATITHRRIALWRLKRPWVSSAEKIFMSMMASAKPSLWTCVPVEMRRWKCRY